MHNKSIIQLFEINARFDTFNILLLWEMELKEEMMEINGSKSQF